MGLTSLSHNNTYFRFSDSAIDMTGTNSGTSAPSAKYTSGTVQVTWSGVTGTATWEIQASVNNSTWDTVPDSSFTTSGGSGSKSIHFTSMPGSFIRVTITSAAAAGSMVVHFSFKR